MSRIAAEPQIVAESKIAAVPQWRADATPPESEPGPVRVIHEVKPRRELIPDSHSLGCHLRMLAIAGYLGNQNQRLNQLLNGDKGQIAQLSADAAHAQEVLDTLTSPAAKQVTLTEGKGAPAPTGRTSYLADKGALVFIGDNLKPIPADKTYELWVIPADGKAPIPAGLFRPDDHGSASVVLPKLPEGVPAKAFGVTIENAEGATTPTMPIVLSGAAGL